MYWNVNYLPFTSQSLHILMTENDKTNFGSMYGIRYWPDHLNASKDTAEQQFINWMIESGRLKIGGEHRLKSGRISPYFINAGSFNTGPDLAKFVGFYNDILLNITQDLSDDKIVIFGPAYKGIPLAVALSIRYCLGFAGSRTAVYSSFRKEAKDHGDAGDWLGYAPKTGDKVVIIDDVITTGATKVEAVNQIRSTGAEVIACIVAFDRMEVDESGKGAVESFTELTGVPVYSIASLLGLHQNLNLTGREAIEAYAGKYGTEKLKLVFKLPLYNVTPAANPIIVALDGLSISECRSLVSELKKHVWGFKLNDAFLDGEVQSLFALNPDTRWFIDLKLHDIPNTVKNQIERVQNRASIRADLLTVHASGSQEMINTAVVAAGARTSILAVTVLTSISPDECKLIYGRTPAEQVHFLAYNAVCAGAYGIVCSAEELEHLSDINCVKVVPGIRPTWHDKADDQKRVGTPAQVRAAGGTMMVIGRPITKAKDPVQAVHLTLKEWFDASAK